MNSPTPTIPSSQFSGSLNTIDSICIGSGRFLRSVLVPALVAADYHPAIVQTRGRSFLEYCIKDAPAQKKHESSNIIQSWTYEVDTVQFDGRVETSTVPFWGAGTLGSVQGKQDVLDLCKSILGSGKSTGDDEGADGKPRELSKPLIVGVGVTEAGLSSSSTKAMKDLYDVLEALSNRPNILQKICVINTDNVPQNGNRIQKLMYELALTDQWMQAFLVDSVIFHNTMVDRITSERTGTSGLVPRAEPTPLKALVIEDLGRNLPPIFSDARLQTECGCIIRTTPGKLNADIALKLRVANGTHTAVAHVMALTGLTETDVLSSDTKEAKLLMKYLDSFFKHQIKKGVEASKDFEATKEDAQAVYDDWRRRLIHAHFGLSTFFITQNGAAKGGIRVGPTVRDLIVSNQASKASLTPIKCSTVFCLAAILRFLTDNMGARDVGPNGKLHIGLLDPKRKYSEQKFVENEFVTYADGLSHNLKGSWYHFRCDCEVSIWNGRSKATQTVPLPKALCLVGASNGSGSGSKQPVDYEAVIKAYLCKPDGGDLSSVAHTLEFDLLVKAIATLYSRMVNGDAMLDILESLNLEASCESLVDGPYIATTGLKGFDASRPLHYKESLIPDDSALMNLPLPQSSFQNYRETITSVVVSEVAAAVAVDLHTHLLPPTHGALCLWGIDELLTYHYLVAEYFVTAPPSVTPESFYALSKQKQADLIWKALFVDRSPISEACRGVITTCVALGLAEDIQKRDLNAIRRFYGKFRDKGLPGAEEFSKHVFSKAGIDYAVMTNIPFEPTETEHWRPTPKDYSKHFRSACRVDPLLAGNRRVVEQALQVAGYETTLEGAKQFLHDWCDTMKPEYLMASTPHDFVLAEDLGTAGSVRKKQKTGVNEEAMKQPFAFVDLVAGSSSRTNTTNSGTTTDAVCDADCGPGEELASVINEDSDFLTDVLMKVCEERDLPLALKIGAHRGVNPKLQAAGDGVVAFADAHVLARLCTRFPKVRFLATFLSRANQHEACVLATKFRNLHLYGCWWFCNNPSIIEEISKMRIEMLGTSFTAQHSDSRVLDQLLYKWPHSRALLAQVISEEYTKLVETGGWTPTRGEIRRDVRRWFGASYEEFLSKSLV